MSGQRKASADGGSQVLVVDDERMIADTLATILNMSGFKATALYSGEAALEWAAKHRPDIVLTDVRMHKMNGIEAATRIRALHPACRMILFTASKLTRVDLRKIDELGFEMLERPLNPRELIGILS